VIDTEELKQVIEANSPSVMLSPGTAEAAARRSVETEVAPIDVKKAENG